MANKIFRSEVDIRNNALRLSEQIHESGFFPNVIYVSLRGGAYLGNIISEYFKLVAPDRQPVLYAAVVAHSYSGFSNTKNVRVDGWTYEPTHLRTGDKVLLVDEIYDSGNTVSLFYDVFQDKGIQKKDMRIAVYDYKVKQYDKDAKYKVKPDYYCHKHVIPSESEEIWIHYLTHELIGLTREELSEHYPEDVQAFLSKHL